MAKKQKPIFNIEEIRKEYSRLLVARNPKAAELKKKIDYFDYGIEYICIFT